MALATLGFNVVILGALTLVTAVIDLVPDETAESLVTLSGSLAHWSSLGLWIGALGFLPWLRKTYTRALAVSPTPDLQERWRQGPVAGFFIPFLNLVRPYQAMRALNDALDPDRVPLPEPRLAPDGATYRQAPAFVFPELLRAAPAPVGLWWTLWTVRAASGILIKASNSNMFIALHDAIICAAAIAASVVVWRVTARLDEVERRHAMLDAAPEG